MRVVFRAESISQRIERSRLHLKDTMSVSDSEETPGHVYAAELDGKSVVIKHYKKKKGGLPDRIIKVDGPAN